jgi:hypothetical protein
LAATSRKPDSLTGVDTSAPDNRFVGLILRDLKASQVRFLPGHTQPPATDNTLCARLPDGRLVVATFAAIPSDRQALGRRLEMLASSFAQASVQEGEVRAKTEAQPRSLHEELRTLAVRALALDAVVIDSQSPIVWGSASTLANASRPEDLRGLGFSRPVLSKERPSHDWEEDSGTLPEAGVDSELAKRAIERFHERAQASPPSGHHGNHGNVSHILGGSAPPSARSRQAAFVGNSSHSEAGLAYFSAGFSGIYAVILVYASPFDEMRAHRAVNESLARIERLVTALPPFEPDPSSGAGKGAGVVTPLRRRR